MAVWSRNNWNTEDPKEIWKSFNAYIKYYNWYDYYRIKESSDYYPTSIFKYLANQKEFNWKPPHTFIGTYKPFKITPAMKKSSYLESLFVDNLLELTEFENLEEIENLYVLEVDFNIRLIDLTMQKHEKKLSNNMVFEEVKNISKYYKLYEILSKLKIKNLHIRFMKNNLSILDHFNPTFEKIEILICYHMHDFDFSFIKKYKKIPKINFYLFDDSMGGYVKGEDIKKTKNKIMLEGKKSFKLNVSYNFQIYPELYPEGTNLTALNDYDINKIEMNWLPIVENRYV